MSLLLAHSIAGTGRPYPAKSKTLLQILVEELPKRGGWPEGVAAMAQDANGAVQNYRDTHDIRIDDTLAFGRSRIDGSYSVQRDECQSASDRLTAIITRDQYEAALAFMRSHEGAKIENLRFEGGELKGEFTTAVPAERIQVNCTLADADGWIEWHGGECPVPEGTLVDVRYRDGQELNALPANDTSSSISDASFAFWRNDGAENDITAYRLHKPQDANSRANDERLEADLNECIGQAVPVPARWTLLAEIHESGIGIDLQAAVLLADYLLDAGYRKQ